MLGDFETIMFLYLGRHTAILETKNNSLAIPISCP